MLLVSVDIENAETATFDSYDTKQYHEGISLNHVIASVAVPKNFAYEEINGQKYWDGGIMSNTPLRELLSQHTIFWKEKLRLDSEKERLTYATWKNWRENEQKIPNVKVCIVNLHPSKEAGSHIPSLDDYDMTKDRENDIRFHDKTEYDLKMGKVVDDYKDFVEQMTDIAIESIDKINGLSTKVNEKEYRDNLKEYYEQRISAVNKVLNHITRTTMRSGNERRYWHLLKHRFAVDEMLKIQREDDSDTISDKIFDFSYDTIDQLIKKGVDDALYKVFEVDKEIEKFVADIREQNTKEDQYLIEAANNIINKNQ